MMGFLKNLLIVLVIAAITHGVLIYMGPAFVMSRATAGMTKAAGGVNAVVNGPRVNADNDTIVRQSPDMLYSSCAYDVSAGALNVYAEVPPGTYWSVSFFDSNTNNYRVINDGQAAGRVNLVLVKAGSDAAKPAGAEIIESPTATGAVLFRTLINNEAQFDELNAVRKTAKCTPLK